MANEIIKDSTNFITASFESLKQITESNIANAKSWFTSPLAVSDWAEVGKRSLSVANGWTDLGKRIIDESIKPCILAFSPDAFVTAVKELNEITTAATENLRRSQVDAMNGYLDEFVQFSADLKKVNGADDLLATQMDFVVQLQQQAKDSTLASLQIFNSMKSALAAWTEKSLDAAAVDVPMPKPKKASEKEQRAA